MQALADFLTELFFPLSSDRNVSEQSVIDSRTTEVNSQIWNLYIDGFANEEDSGVRLLLVNPDRQGCFYTLRFNFSASDNKAKYEALVTGFKIARQIGLLNI